RHELAAIGGEKAAGPGVANNRILVLGAYRLEGTAKDARCLVEDLISVTLIAIVGTVAKHIVLPPRIIWVIIAKIVERQDADHHGVMVEPGRKLRIDHAIL